MPSGGTGARNVAEGERKMMENATVIGKYMEIVDKEPVLDRKMLGIFYSVHLHVFTLSGFRHVFYRVLQRVDSQPMVEGTK